MIKDAEVFLVFLLAVFMFTEFFYPVLKGKKLFPSFRKQEAEVKTELKDKVEEAKEKVAEVKDVVDEVTKEFDKVKDLKKDADDMLK